MPASAPLATVMGFETITATLVESDPPTSNPPPVATLPVGQTACAENDPEPFAAFVTCVRLAVPASPFGP